MTGHLNESWWMKLLLDTPETDQEQLQETLGKRHTATGWGLTMDHVNTFQSDFDTSEWWIKLALREDDSTADEKNSPGNGSTDEPTEAMSDVSAKVIVKTVTSADKSTVASAVKGASGTADNADYSQPKDNPDSPVNAQAVDVGALSDDKTPSASSRSNAKVGSITISLSACERGK